MVVDIAKRSTLIICHHHPAQFIFEQRRYRISLVIHLCLKGQLLGWGLPWLNQHSIAEEPRVGQLVFLKEGDRQHRERCQEHQPKETLQLIKKHITSRPMSLRKCDLVFLNGVTAINHNKLAGDVACLFTCKKHCNMAHFLRSPWSSHGGELSCGYFVLSA